VTSETLKGIYVSKKYRLIYIEPNSSETLYSEALRDNG